MRNIVPGPRNILRKHASEDREIFLTKIYENKSLAYLKLQQVLVNPSPRKPNKVWVPVSIEFQLISGRRRNIVRGPRNILQKHEFGVSLTSPSKYIPSKTELSLSPRSIEFQFVSGPPQAQHSPRTAKYFTKTCVRGLRNIFNETKTRIWRIENFNKS